MCACARSSRAANKPEAICKSKSALYNPLGQRYWSCTPYLLGEGQAMLYSFAPQTKVDTRIPGIPFGQVPFNYRR